MALLVVGAQMIAKEEFRAGLRGGEWATFSHALHGRAQQAGAPTGKFKCGRAKLEFICGILGSGRLLLLGFLLFGVLRRLLLGVGIGPCSRLGGWRCLCLSRR